MTILYTEIKDKDNETISLMTDINNIIHSKEDGLISNVMADSLTISEGEIYNADIDLPNEEVIKIEDWLNKFKQHSDDNAININNHFNEGFNKKQELLNVSAKEQYDANIRPKIDIVSIGTNPTNYAGISSLQKYKRTGE